MKKALSISALVFASIVWGNQMGYAADVGPMSANKVPAFDVTLFGRTPFEHPYICVRSNECYALHGRNYGGDYLSGTWGVGDRDKTRCVAKTPSRCAVTWGVTGTSQQEGNRMLWPAGTKVTAARGYWILYPRFGHYGDSPFGSVSWTLCKRACSR